jgi:mono/diheme cytochrome c family protein
LARPEAAGSRRTTITKIGSPRFWLLVGCLAGLAGLAAAQQGGGVTPPAGTSAPPAGTNGTTAPGVIDGATLFATTCGWCHQDGGRAEGRGPKLAGTEKSDAVIINRIKTGKAGAMPAFGGAFSDAQLQAIVAYIRGLKTASQ